MKKASTKETPKKTVIIIGAGLAGLSCAYKLLSEMPAYDLKNFEIVILEARNRVGGRVETFREPFSDNLCAEAGAFWISENHALVIHYINKFKLVDEKFVLVPPGTSLPYYFQRVGHLLALHESGLAIDVKKNETPLIDWPILKRNDEMGGGFWALLGRYICSQSAMVDAAAPKWPGTGLSTEIQTCDDMSFLDFLKKQGASDEAIELIRPWFAWWDDLDQVSALCLLRDGAVTRQMCQDPIPTWYTIKGGMDELPNKFKEELRNNATIILDAPVTKISQDETSVSVTYGKAGKEQTLKGTYLVSAIPFSTLRDIKDLPFSQEKLYAIRNLPYATVARVYVQCKERVWDLKKQFNGVAFLDLPSDLPANPAICRMNLLDMTFAQKNTQGILQAYMVGMLGERVTAMKHDQRIEFFLKQLEIVYPGIAKSYREAGCRNASKCWDEEEWSQGAYPLYRPGQMIELIPHLASPEGRVYFAGDHTWGRPGWMEGALQSGHRAAKEISRRAAREIAKPS